MPKQTNKPLASQPTTPRPALEELRKEDLARIKGGTNNGGGGVSDPKGY